MIKRVIALLLLTASITLFLIDGQSVVAGGPISDPLGVIDRDQFDNLISLCDTLEQKLQLRVNVSIDSVIADEPIVSRASALLPLVEQQNQKNEWVFLYLLSNGESFYTASEGFIKKAEEIGVANLDLLVMKEFELSGIEKALEAFLVNVTFVASQADDFPLILQDDSQVKQWYSTMIGQLILALMAAMGLAILLFDYLFSRGKEAVVTFPTPLFQGDFIQYESSLFGSGLTPKSKRSTK